MLFSTYNQRLFVEFAVVFKSLELVFCLFSRKFEEFFCSVGELLGQAAVTCFILDEVDIVSRGLFAVERERILAFRFERGVESEHLPITCLDSLFHLVLAVLHAALLDTVHFAGSVADDQGRSVVCLSLGKCFEKLALIRAHGNLCNVNVAVRFFLPIALPAAANCAT